MTCREVRALMNDFVDGILPQYEEFAVEEHLRTCTDCRDQEMRLTALLDKAQGLPRHVEPPFDLWTKIAVRISRQEVKKETRSFRFYGASLAAAAVVLLMIGTGLGFWLATTGQKNSPMQVVAKKPAQDPITACTTARDELLKELDQRKDDFSPEVYAVVKGNLRVIDGAITEISLALQNDPQSEPLKEMLIATYQKQVDLLASIISLAPIA